MADQDGDFDDWIELYNNSSSTIDLEGYFLSDDADDQMQWTFPAGTEIEANGYLIVWADGDDDQSGLHANFKLSASGESIFLLDAAGIVIDEVSYAEQTTDISYGRFPNGTGAFQTMSTTFNAENAGTTTSTTDIASETVLLKAFPNPTDHSFYLKINGEEHKERLVAVYNLDGTVFYQNTIFGNTYIDVSDWASGMYIVRVDNAFLKMVVN